MDKYHRISSKVDMPDLPPGSQEIRVVSNSQKGARSYISDVIQQFEANGGRSVTITGLGKAINKTIGIVEIVKRRIPDLHQCIKLFSTTIQDSYEPLVAGFEPKKITRTISAVSVILSKEQLDICEPGYQPPLPSTEVKTEVEARTIRQALLSEHRPKDGGGVVSQEAVPPAGTRRRIPRRGPVRAAKPVATSIEVTPAPPVDKKTAVSQPRRTPWRRPRRYNAGTAPQTAPAETAPCRK